MDFVSVLRSIQTAQVNAAEEALKQFKQDPRSYLMNLVSCAQSSELEVGTRQLAAVLLREALSYKSDSAYGLLPQDARIALKQEIPQWILSTKDHDIRRRMSECLSVYYGSLKRDKQEWTELLPWLFSLSESSDASQRELAFLALSRVAPIIFSTILPNLSYLRTALSKAFQDQSGEVRLAAIRAFTAIVCACDEVKQVKVLRELMAPVSTTMQHLAEAIVAQYSESTVEALETTLAELAEIAESRAVFFRPILADFCNVLLGLASQAMLPNECRNLALEILVLFTEKLKKTIKTSPQLLSSILTLTLTLMCDLPEDEDWENLDPTDHDYDEEAVYFAAERGLDRMALSLGGKKLFPLIMPLIKHLVSLPSWNQRSAGLNAISLIGEGCADELEITQLNEMVDLVLSAMTDSHPRVRWFAVNSFGQLATDFTPIVQENFHSRAVPLLVKLLGDSSSRVQIHTASSLINYAEEAPADTIQPYMDMMTNALFPMLDAPLKRGKEQSVTALAALAKSCGNAFGKFYDTLMPFLVSILTHATSSDTQTLRGKAVECISLIGIAVGKDRFLNDAQKVLNILLEISAQLKQEGNISDKLNIYIPSSCCRIAQCLGEAFTPYLPIVIPPLLETAGKDIQVTKSAAIDPDNPDSEVQEGYTAMLLENDIVSVYTHDVHEASQAISLLTTYMAHLEGAFFPFLEQTIRIIGERLNHFTVDLAEAALAACPYVLKVAVKAPQSEQERSAYVMQVLNFMIPKIIKSLNDSVSFVEISNCVRALEGLFRVLGPGNAPPNHSQTVITLVLDQLNKLLNEQEEVEEAEDFEDDDKAMLFVALVETLGTIAVGMGDSFVPIFSNIWPTFKQMLDTYKPSPNHTLTSTDELDSSDVTVLRVQTSLCLLDDVLDHCKQGIEPLITEALPYFVDFMRFPNESVKQAAVYGAAVCAQKHSQQTKSFAPTILQNFCTLADRPNARTKDNDGTSDNVLAGLIRLTLAYPDVCPPQQAWSLIFKLLPLKVDVAEVKYVYSTVINTVLSPQGSGIRSVIGGGNEHVGMVRVIQLLSSVYSTELITDEVNQMIENTIKANQSSLTQEDQSMLWQSLNDTQQVRLKRLLGI
ncbi:hypothetical protein P9112_012289 [Eukaryota sp. TZLM1-RC]